MKLPPGVPNPFRASIVADPWRSDDVDVAEIHADVFDECCRAVEQVRATGTTTGLLIHGEAGSGKTHLLARLRARLTGGQGRRGLSDPDQVFVSVRLQTSPQMIWRHVRRRFAADLLRKTDDGLSQLEHVLCRRLAETRDGVEGDLACWWEYIRENEPRAVDDLLDRLSEEPDFDRNLTVALEHLAHGTRLRDVRSWLKGDPLPEQALEAMGLRTGEDDDPEAEARRVIVALANLSGAQVPIVFCFDQVEALQVTPQDTAGLFAFGQLVEALHAETRNLLMISCMQSTFLTMMTSTIRGANYDRMREYGQRSLNPLQWNEAVRLLSARMDAIPTLAALRAAQRDSLWPFTEPQVRDVVGDQGCTPRRLLSTCAERFAQFELPDGQIPSVVTEPLEEFLRRDWEQRLESAVASNGPEQTEPILAHGLPLLVNAAAPEWKRVMDERLPDVDLVLQGPDSRVGVSLCTHANMTSLAARLRRLGGQMAHLEKLILVRDSRTPVSAGAAKTRQRLAELERQDVRLVRPSAEALAALDALRGLLSDARSGDLSQHGRTVGVESIQEWLREHLPVSLRELTEEVVAFPRPGPVETAPDAFEDLTDYLRQHHLVDLADAADALGHPVETLERCSREHPQQFVLLGGPPAVVFELVADGDPSG